MGFLGVTFPLKTVSHRFNEDTERGDTVAL
jgi:hypothetical protein